MIAFFRRRQRALRIATASVVVGAVGVGIAVAEDVWVKRPYVEAWAGTDSMYPRVFKADKGAKLTVIDHEGKWVKVLYNGQTGYVFEDALSTSEMHPEVLQAIKGSGSSGASAASAGKGFTATEFATAKGLSEEPLNKLEVNVQAAITHDGFEKFMKDGKVGPKTATTRR